MSLKAEHSNRGQIRFTGAVLISVRRFQVNAPAIAVLCKWGRRLCPSHVIACKYRYDSRVLCSSLFAASRYWGHRPRRRSTGLQSLSYPGNCARCRGSLPGWGCSASSSTRACRPDRGACRTGGGASSIAARTIDSNVISTTALASRTKPRIRIAGEEPGWPLQRARCRKARPSLRKLKTIR